MTPVDFPESNAVLGAGQDEYEPLPAHRFPDAQGTIAFCCRLSDEEIGEIRRTRTLWLTQMTFGNNFQPIALSTRKPHGMRAPLQAPAKFKVGDKVSLTSEYLAALPADGWRVVEGPLNFCTVYRIQHDQVGYMMVRAIDMCAAPTGE